MEVMALVLMEQPARLGPGSHRAVRVEALRAPHPRTLEGDPQLFITSDEGEEAWRIIDPVMNAWSVGDVPLQEDPTEGAPPDPASSTTSGA